MYCIVKRHTWLSNAFLVSLVILETQNFLKITRTFLFSSGYPVPTQVPGR